LMLCLAGNAVLYCVVFVDRLRLKKGRGENRVMKVVDSPILPESEASTPSRSRASKTNSTSGNTRAYRPDLLEIDMSKLQMRLRLVGLLRMLVCRFAFALQFRNAVILAFDSFNLMCSAMPAVRVFTGGERSPSEWLGRHNCSTGRAFPPKLWVIAAGRCRLNVGANTDDLFDVVPSRDQAPSTHAIFLSSMMYCIVQSDTLTCACIL
jgi:hypothetical protein